MKILFPIGAFYPAQVGGPSNTVYWLAKGLAKENFQVSVITTCKGIDRNKIKSNKWQKLNDFEIIYHTYFFWQFPMKMFISVFKEIKNNNIIVLSSFFYLPSIFIILFSLCSNKTVVVSPRGELASSALQFKSITKKLRLWFVKLFIKKRKIIFHSTSCKETDEIKALFPYNKIIEIPNLLELPKKKNATIEDKFLFLGRIHPIKAISNLIEGLAKSEKFRGSNYILNVAGKESESAKGHLQELKKQVTAAGLENKIFFLGEVKGNNKQELLSSSKFLFLMSHSENFGNVVIESLAQSTPVVASKGTPWSILQKEKAGYHISNEPFRIQNQIDEIIELQDDEYLLIRENAQKVALNHFDISTNISQWESVLTNLFFQ